MQDLPGDPVKAAGALQMSTDCRLTTSRTQHPSFLWEELKRSYQIYGSNQPQQIKFVM
jgi:hypothetical protein